MHFYSCHRLGSYFHAFFAFDKDIQFVILFQNVAIVVVVIRRIYL
jgi:hypothetical protein